MKNHFEPHTKKLADESLSNITGELMQLYVVRPVAKPITDFNEYSDMDINDFSEGDIDENGDFSNIFGKGRRKACKAKGLKGKDFRDCVKELTKEDKGLSKSERKEKKKLRKEDYSKALVEGKVLKGEKGRKATHSILKFYPLSLAMRGAVLSIINLNIVDIAHAFSLIKNDKDQTHWKQIQQKWWQWGGDKNHLDSAVEKGKNKKPLFKDLIEKFHKKKHGFDGYSNADGKGLDTAGNIVAGSAALMGIASGVLASIPEPTATTKAAAGYLGIGTGAFGAMSPILKSYAKQKGADAEKLASIPPVPTGDKNPDNIPVVPPTDAKVLAKVVEDIQKQDDSNNKSLDDDGKIWGMPKMVVYIGGVLVTFGLIWGGYKLIKHKSPKI